MQQVFSGPAGGLSLFWLADAERGRHPRRSAYGAVFLMEFWIVPGAGAASFIRGTALLLVEYILQGGPPGERFDGGDPCG